MGTSAVETWLLKRIFEKIGPAPIRFAWEGGAPLSMPGAAPVATLRFRDLSTLLSLALDPEVGFGEAYSDGRIQVEGNLVAALEAVYKSMAAIPRRDRIARLKSKWMEWWQDNSPRGSRSNIHRHYDVGNEFYKLWLDRELVYTCAYFPTPSVTLEEAQIAKMDYICRKLYLQPGETVVDAGCGWGALAFHMATHYGASVKAFNISHEQILYARRQAMERGLSQRVEFIEEDYRNISGKFDAFVSVGMLEHVGLGHYADLGRAIHRSIGDSGRGLLHFIGRSYKSEFSRWIRKRIFPGAYAPELGEAMRVLKPYGYSVLDVENLRLHYAKTLEHWLDRFDKAGERVSEMYDPWFRRAWRLYLAGSIAGFRSNTLQLFQIVFAGSKRTEIPWTRAALYADERTTEQDPTWMHATF
jgi:cyclopropane-fatty-acyl-phospholipid synthase